MKFDLLHPADQLVMMMDRIYNYGMTTTSGGNISILDTDGNIWITPSSVDKGSLTRDDIVLVKKDGTIVSKHKPSVELPFHKLVYETRPDAKAVLHAHPPAMVSFSLTRKVPNIRCMPTAYHICGKIGVAEYEVPGSIKLGQNIAKVFEQGHNVVMMDNHGVVVCGSDVFEAFKRFETVDYCARLNIEGAKLGKLVELTDKQLSCAGARSIIPMDKFVPSIHTSEEREARRKMVELTKRAYKQKLFTSTQGSFSQRLAGSSFIITPYDKDRMYMDAEDIVRVDGDKSELGKIPSRSTQLHKMIYEKHPEINSIIIAHPVHALAFGATRTDLNSRTIPESYIMMRDLGRVPFETYYQDNKKICDLLSEVNPLILIENDGLIVTGSGLLNCFDRLEVADFTAKTLIDSRVIGEAVAITDKDVEVIKKDFKLK